MRRGLTPCSFNILILALTFHLATHSPILHTRSILLHAATVSRLAAGKATVTIDSAPDVRNGHNFLATLAGPHLPTGTTTSGVLLGTTSGSIKVGAGLGAGLGAVVVGVMGGIAGVLLL